MDVHLVQKTAKLIHVLGFLNCSISVTNKYREFIFLILHFVFLYTISLHIFLRFYCVIELDLEYIFRYRATSYYICYQHYKEGRNCVENGLQFKFHTGWGGCFLNQEEMFYTQFYLFWIQYNISCPLFAGSFLEPE